MEFKICLDKTLGYEYFIDRDCQISNSQGKVYVHRYIASLKIGGWLTTDEHVHHIDGNKRHNDPENLLVMSASQHSIEEARLRGFRVGDDKFHQCPACGRKTQNDVYCSIECASISSRKVERPPREQLEFEIESGTNWCALGRKYGVTDNAVRKWARTYRLI